MRQSELVLRGLKYYWRTNAAVVLGVATAVAVLAGALLVGDSVRGSLRDLVLERLGRTDRVVVSSGFFREALADDLRADAAFATSFSAICPIVVVQGVVTEQETGRRASRVFVYGVDDRFWQFHGLSGTAAPAGRDALLSPSLAADIGAAAGSTVLVRVERPSAIPLESLHGRKEDAGRTLRLTVRAIAAPGELGEFSLQPQQGGVLAVFVPLQRLQEDLDLDGRANTLLVSDRPPGAEAADPRPLLEALIRRRASLEDLGLSLRPIESRGVLALESAAGLLDPPQASAAGQAASNAGMSGRAVLTYLANTLRSGDREVPYSLVTATDLESIAGPPAVAASTAGPPPMVLNDWTARELRVSPGDPVALDYYVWEDPGRLVSRSADFQVAAVVPIEGAAADRDLAPVYPGITDSDRLGDWDPPFPIDLERVRPADEEYWNQHRTTPKAFIPLEAGQRLWRSRYGELTSLRIAPAPGQSLADARERYAISLRAAADPFGLGIAVRDVRADGLAASRGATDFGEYFAYFSMFLVVSALMLAALFFRLGVEQRAREVGLLGSVGYTTSRIRRLFVAEGLVLAVIGSVIGIGGAIGYAAVMMAGLRTWWAGAVGTNALALHVSPVSLAAGAAGAVVASVACIWWTLRGLASLSERSLLAGSLAGDERAPSASAGRLSPRTGAIGFGALAAVLMAAAFAGAIDRTGAFFGAGSALLVSCLCLIATILRRPSHSPIDARGWWPLSRLGLRNAAVRPGRSVLAVGVIASATFILISVDAFRRSGEPGTDRNSGVGGYPLLVDLLVPIAHDPNGRDGRELLGLVGFDDVNVEPFRVLPGDDASCLNLYEPTSPRILGVSPRFIASGRFAFSNALSPGEAERANPWLLLNRELSDGDGPIVPVIADANSIAYVLHRTLGDDIVINQGGRPVRLRLVAALADSIFQSELVMSEANFLKLFPDRAGYQFMLVDAPGDRAAEVAETIERTAGDLGADAQSTEERLARFHIVENTYLSTFQTLGGLGLLVGTVGLAAVLLRNVLERRRELALLGAVGYRRTHIFIIILAENVLLLGWGLAIGTASALVAVSPAVVERGGRLPTTSGAWLLLIAVFAAGLLSSMIATRAALRSSLLGALRAD